MWKRISLRERENVYIKIKSRQCFFCKENLNGFMIAGWKWPPLPIPGHAGIRFENY